jgi:DNA-3-methyladenine glycosylase II
VFGDADIEAVRRQVARVLSLDHDGAAFVRIGDRDPVIARLLAAAPGLRPPLFYSPYEAAAWAVLSVRRVPKQMSEVRRRLSEAHGATFELAGERVAAFPTPDQLLVVDAFPGISADRMTRLHGVARAALDGWLDVSRIHKLGPEAAMEDLQRINGIGPFYSALIVNRASGFADVLPRDEQKALALVGELYGLGGPATAERLTGIAEAWRPFRTWAIVLIRAAASRLAPATG